MKNLYSLLIFTLLFCYTAQAFADSAIKGIVTDQKNGEPLPGATVTLKNERMHTKISTSVGLDGSYSFKNVTAGSYEVEAKYVGYKDEEKHTEINGNVPLIIINLALQGKGHDLSEVNIKSRTNQGSDQAARRIEQRADQVVNAVSSHSIEISPDITIANVTQRISGVSVERSNNGEAQYAIIRGMPQRYQYTLINGIKIPSPSNTNRYVPLDIFPADIVDRLEVYKSLTASQEGDAIGGAINLALKDAPDDFALHLNVGTGYAENFFNHGFTQFDHSASLSRSPRIKNGADYIATMNDFPNSPFHYSTKNVPLASILGFSVGGRSHDKKLGALLAGSYQNTYRQTNGVFFNTQVNLTNNEPSVQDFQSRTYNIQQQRAALIGKLDYRFDSANKLTLNGSYINLMQNEYRFASDTSFLGRTAVGNGRVNEGYRSDRTIQQVYNVNLQGDHTLLPNFRANWMAVYSKATANEPDRADLNLNTGRNIQPDGSVVQASTTFDALQSQTRIFTYNSDQDKTGYLNLIYSPQLFNTKVEFSAGGMYRDKDRHSDYDEYDLRVSGNTAQTFNGNIDNNTFAVFNGQGRASDALNYTFNEKIGAAYGQFKFTAGKLQTIGGLRYEHTSQAYETNASEQTVGKNGTNHYYDFLPSLNFKYMLSEHQNLRLSYYSAISRPNFYEIIPHTSGDPDADYKEIGNPTLKRTTAENFDFRYELFPKGLDELLVGVFYKAINNPIENALVRQTSSAGSTSTNLVLQPQNFGTAHNYGFEFEAVKYIHNFGVRLNYTYTDSKITTSKLVNYRDASGYVTNRLENQTRPLQGQSKNIGNFSFLYKDGKAGLDAQLSLVYTGSRINLVSGYLDNDVWQKAFTTLDFSTEKRLFKNLYGYFKATNLLNTPFQLELHRPYPESVTVSSEYQKDGANAFVRRDTYNRYYILGLRYRL
ncbi:TonB-dependent receptor [Mucilaginibacter robiniae]|uniref:TonB-dependent receptor n=1 Tax=Mucilaginibacter robiniae TaxID=2728022 RepID=A0A7L5E1E5_9SPHI|nr:TonB-dependent receptor [Mucilaginibacter robiniae]QJD96328.1 TonB-dependent receptor [Mucilaginibacter robiniae]